MEAIAKTRHLKGSPRKARLVIDMIRGVNVSRALAILQFTDKRAAEPIAKTLRSAIANATFKAEKQNIAIDPDDLYVKACYVDMGAHKNRRRMRPAPQGRAYREQRHYCHITIEVSNDKPAAADEGKVRNAKTAAAATDGETKSATSKRAATKKTDAGERTAKAKQSDEKPQVVEEAETATAANTANEEAAEGNVEATATPTEEKQA
jgi:large subunit ribosomal protein L22